MADDVISHAYVMNPPQKSKGQGSESFLIGGLLAWGGCGSSSALPACTPCPMRLFHLAVHELVFYNKSVI